MAYSLKAAGKDRTSNSAYAPANSLTAFMAEQIAASAARTAQYRAIEAANQAEAERQAAINDRMAKARKVKADKAAAAAKKAAEEAELARQRVISAANLAEAQAASARRYIEAQQSSIKREILNGFYSEQAKVIVTLAPHIDALKSNNTTIVAEAKKARNQVYYKIFDTAFFFHDTYKNAKNFVKDDISKIVAKLTKTCDLVDCSIEDIKAEFTKKYLAIGDYFVIPAGAVFTVVKGRHYTWLNLYTINTNLTLSKEDSWQLDPDDEE